jgi:hypothetical protein
MPRLNYGTLLENLIVLEVTRFCFDHSEHEEAIAFASSFAMPPLTECWCTAEDERTSPVFNHDFLRHLAEDENAEQSLQELWSLCIANQPNLPICEYSGEQDNSIRYGTGGPNGTLLAAMLAAQRGRTIDVWVNDNGDRYGQKTPNKPSAQSELPQTLAHGGVLVGMPGNGNTTERLGMFPDSLPDLHAWLIQRIAHFDTRVGFLDPDNYNTEGQAVVSSFDHRQWLRVLAIEGERVLSVMFFFCRDRRQNRLTRRVERFHNDELELYPQSLVFEYGNFLTGVKIRWPENEIGELVMDLSQRIFGAWRDWNLRKNLRIHINGQPG